MILVIPQNRRLTDYSLIQVVSKKILRSKHLVTQGLVQPEARVLFTFGSKLELLRALGSHVLDKGDDT